MCGIVGYIGKSQVEPILINALSTLEYRGYDSCGIAVKNGAISIFKDAIRVQGMKEYAPRFEGTLGIGHTRWATHGKPSATNSHPHTDCHGRFAVVHNGIINNYQKLKDQLTSEGHRFLSDTDTEVIPHLIEKYYQGNLEQAVTTAVKDLEGSYALAVLSNDEEKLVAIRKQSPLVIGIGDREFFLASDVPAIIEYTDRIIYLEDNDVVIFTPQTMKIISDEKEIQREEHKILWHKEDVQRSGYEHFMLKEIHEQPRIMQDALGGFIQLYGKTTMKGNFPFKKDEIKSLTIVACGTSYHAGLIGKYVFEELHGIPVRVELGSEFNHCRRTIPTSTSIIISQSGETADVLSAMKRLQEAMVKTVAITNVTGSTLARTADHTFYTKAGPEISVAATKSFIAQLMALFQFALSYPGIPRSISEHLMMEFRQLSNKVEWVINNSSEIEQCARFLSQYENAFFIGRGINFPVALEGALKLKEISYIHAEGYAAGELKHGSIALLQSNTPLVAIAARDNTYDAMISNIKQAKARSAPVLAIADQDDDDIDALVDHVIKVPHTDNLFTPVLNSVVMQLLAYHTTKIRGCPIDFPRNLAKSVTVE